MNESIIIVGVIAVIILIAGFLLFAAGGKEKAGEGESLPAFDNIKFALITDFHLVISEQKGNSDGYRLGLKTVSILEKTVEEFNRDSDLDFVLVAGDLTVDAEPWNVDKTKEILSRLKAPYYVILGNHDSSPIRHNKKDQPVGLSKYAVSNTFIGKSGGGMEPGRTYYAREVAKDLLLVALDTTHLQIWDPAAGMANFSGSIDPAQMVWLEKTLAVNKGKTIIVMQHHGAVPFAEGDKTNHNNWGWFMIENGDAVQALYKKYGVKAVLSGHHHISTRAQNVDGVYHITNAPLTSYPMRYTMYNVTPKGLSYEAKDVPVPAEWHELVKKNFLASKWWRDAEHTMTPEDDAKYLEFYEGTADIMASLNFK